MKKYMAPLEGITTYIFRNAYEHYYGGIDKYFAPFMAPADNCAMNPKEKRDVLPENNDGINLVPQILTCKSKHFIEATKVLMDMGYDEVNLNLGCPSGTVCSKKKGAGFLSETDDLDAFLEDIYGFAEQNKIKVSLKTRIGRFEPDEWEYLLFIYNKYPVSELIVHPRVASDFYKGEPRIDYFIYALQNSKNPVVYNGNLFSPNDVQGIEEIIKTNKIKGDVLNSVKAVDKTENEPTYMFGRGLLYNPELLENISNKNQTSNQTSNQMSNQTSNRMDEVKSDFDYKHFRCFHDEIYHEYQKIMAPDINVLYRMKELWTYWRELFPDSDKNVKRILKSKKYGEYEAELAQMFRGK